MLICEKAKRPKNFWTFDIETSSQYVDGRKTAHLVCWSAYDGKNVEFGRTWESFKELIRPLKKGTIIYVHNLSYEFQFMKKEFEWEKIFATDERRVIYAKTKSGVIFKCSLALSNRSLASWCDAFDVEVKKGDGWDYEKVRTHVADLTDEELRYSLNDVISLHRCIQKEVERAGDEGLPLTATSYVRRDLEKALPTITKKRLKKMQATEDEYTLLEQSFMGGFTHANPIHVGHVLENVGSYDLSSAYPAVMVEESYPMCRGEYTADFPKMNIPWVGMIQLKKVVQKDDVPDSYIPSSKCVTHKNATLNNGRVFSADELVIPITNVDYSIIKKVYTFDEAYWLFGFKYKKFGKLPAPILNYIHDLYFKKCTLKNVDGKEDEYRVAKEKINSIYGMCATKLNRPTFEWDEQSCLLLAGDKKMLSPSEQRSITLYSWAVFVTAFVRRNIWSAILECGDDYVYSDTDSIKFLNFERHKSFFETFNACAFDKNALACKYLEKPINAFSISGKTLGAFEFEGIYKHFKTWGAKRYLLTDSEGNLHLTVAGVNKKKGVEFLNSFADPYQVFVPGLIFPPPACGRKILTYIDDEDEYSVDGVVERPKSSIHMEGGSYTMGLSGEFEDFLTIIQGGDINA